MFKLVLEKAEELDIKLPTSAGSWKKQDSSRKTSISALLTMPKPLTVWITNCGRWVWSVGRQVGPQVSQVARMSVSAKKSPTRVTICCRKGDTFQGPKLGSCLTFGNELSEETHVLTKQEILLGKGTQVESSRVRKPRRTALPRGSQCTRGVSFRPFRKSSGW